MAIVTGISSDALNMDLGSYFAQITSGITPIAKTAIVDKNGNDLATVFYPFVSGYGGSTNTGIKSGPHNNADLTTLFSIVVPLTVSVTAIGATADLEAGESGVPPEDLDLDSSPSGGYPPYTYQWTVVSLSDSYKGYDLTSQDMYFASSASELGAGTYTCSAYIIVTDSKGNTAQSGTSSVSFRVVSLK